MAIMDALESIKLFNNHKVSIILKLCTFDIFPSAEKNVKFRPIRAVFFAFSRI